MRKQLTVPHIYSKGMSSLSEVLKNLYFTFISEYQTCSQVTSTT